MLPNPLRELHHHGQSVWLDQLTRDWLDNGQLAAWIEADGLRGVTSNPSIFEKAITQSADYDAAIAALAAGGLDAWGIYDALTMEDIRRACDAFSVVYAASDGHDGFVSHEVSPSLAHDAAGTEVEVRRLWRAVGRPNLMVKVPATAEGLVAAGRCLADGVNVNFTLMFSLAHYDAVAECYLGALEERSAAGRPVARVASVASFFVSRVDTYVDGLIDKRLEREADTPDARSLRGLRGLAAVANAKMAYARYQDVFDSPRFARLEARGARPQRVLWASTSTKDPAYSDVKYVEELIGPHTVNTLPLETLDAFRDHGRVRDTLTADVASAGAVVRNLKVLGIDLLDVGQELSVRGIAAFAKALEQVLAAIGTRRAGLAP